MDARSLWLTTFATMALLGCGDDESTAGGQTTGSNTGNSGSGASSNAGGAGASGTGATGVGGSGGTPSTGEYPAGPYGVNVGDTMENLLWHGYVNDDAVGLANTEPFIDYSMDDVRQSGKGLAFVHFGAVF